MGKLNSDVVRFRYEQATKEYEKLIKMKENMVGKNVADVVMSVYRRYHGDCLKNLGRYEEAIESYKTSIRIREELPVGTKLEKCCAIANTTCKFAFLCKNVYYRVKCKNEATLTLEFTLIN